MWLYPCFVSILGKPGSSRQRQAAAVLRALQTQHSGCPSGAEHSGTGPARQSRAQRGPQRLLHRPHGCPLAATGCPEHPAPGPGPADTFTAPAPPRVTPPPPESKSHLVTQVSPLICKGATILTHQRKAKQHNYQL